jgi:hypothetical protein
MDFLVFYLLVTAIFVMYKKLYIIQVNKKIAYLMQMFFYTASFFLIVLRALPNRYSNINYLDDILLVGSTSLFALYFLFNAVNISNKNLKSVSFSYLLFTLLSLISLEKLVMFFN